MESRLNESKSTTLSFFGEGTVVIGPSFYNERWEITTVAVSTSTAVQVATARIYTGAAIPGNLLAATYDGSGDSTDTSVRLEAGQQLTCVWGNEGGDGGAIATLSVYGRRFIGE